MKARLTLEAEQDVEEAVGWYDRKSEFLGDDLQSPKMYPTVFRRMRRALVETFPYQVIYEIDPDVIVVYAVYHCARDPEGWKRRP